jgi:hypothetical protein
MVYAGHVWHSGAFGMRNINTLFSRSGGPGAVYIKSAPEHVKFVFLHQVGFAGHKGHYSAFGERNVDALFLAWVGPERFS